MKEETEEQFNIRNDLTAMCLWCKGPMKDDGREYCSLLCYRTHTALKY